MKENNDNFTVAGTDIDAVKEQSRRSGLSYNEAKEWIAKTSGGRGTNVYSDTDVEEVKRKNRGKG
ncbi:gamma-type small acid-soluble spore protein [Virgibacillus byunsanensis]|uniref:Gamma-type small acid-soluble spore protein n=1 Tax=Virgibacillus byunsanensis TaxID=570945 RepID=A0ABW3LJJ7_9BACI